MNLEKATQIAKDAANRWTGTQKSIFIQYITNLFDRQYFDSTKLLC